MRFLCDCSFLCLVSDTSDVTKLLTLISVCGLSLGSFLFFPMGHHAPAHTCFCFIQVMGICGCGFAGADAALGGMCGNTRPTTWRQCPLATSLPAAPEAFQTGSCPRAFARAVPICLKVLSHICTRLLLPLLSHPSHCRGGGAFLTTHSAYNHPRTRTPPSLLWFPLTPGSPVGL